MKKVIQSKAQKFSEKLSKMGVKKVNEGLSGSQWHHNSEKKINSILSKYMDKYDYDEKASKEFANTLVDFVRVNTSHEKKGIMELMEELSDEVSNIRDDLDNVTEWDD